MEVVSGDNWSYKTCKAPVKSPPPTKQHPTSYRPDALPIAQPTVSKHRREKCQKSGQWHLSSKNHFSFSINIVLGNHFSFM